MKLEVPGSVFWFLSTMALTAGAADLLIYGPSRFSWLRIAALSLITAAAVKMYLDARRIGAEETDGDA